MIRTMMITTTMIAVAAVAFPVVAVAVVLLLPYHAGLVFSLLNSFADHHLTLNEPMRTSDDAKRSRKRRRKVRKETNHTATDTRQESEQPMCASMAWVGMFTLCPVRS